MTSQVRPAAVLFDFSGTLFRFEADDTWFAGLHDASGRPLPADRRAELVRRMTQPVGLPADLSAADRAAWERRDLDPELHRRAYLAMLRASGLDLPGSAEALYDQVIDPRFWRPFADTVPVLRGLAAAGIPIGVVSNIAFDLRSVLARHGVDGLVAAYALSYEVGVIKPAATIFRAALEMIGVSPERTLMIGDSEHADGGARALGCAFELVADLPADRRPHALRDALGRGGIDLSVAEVDAPRPGL
ncbi:MAG: HAD family hydrolase [Gordonia sp. (in: high G+C Gram-positive bacteria)]